MCPDFRDDLLPVFAAGDVVLHGMGDDSISRQGFRGRVCGSSVDVGEEHGKSLLT